MIHHKQVGILTGRTTLVAGVSPAISVPGLSATSRIGYSVANLIGTVAQVTAQDADRVLGSSGTFRLRSLNVLDLSDVDWWVFV